MDVEELMAKPIEPTASQLHSKDQMYMGSVQITTNEYHVDKKHNYEDLFILHFYNRKVPD